MTPSSIYILYTSSEPPICINATCEQWWWVFQNWPSSQNWGKAGGSCPSTFQIFSCIFYQLLPVVKWKHPWNLYCKLFVYSVSSIYNLDFGFLDCLYVFTCTPRRCKDKGIPIHPPIHPEYFYVSFFLIQDIWWWFVKWNHTWSLYIRL